MCCWPHLVDIFTHILLCDTQEEGQTCTSVTRTGLISSRQGMRIKKYIYISMRGSLADQAQNSPNLHHKNCLADSQEN